MGRQIRDVRFAISPENRCDLDHLWGEKYGRRDHEGDGGYPAPASTTTFIGNLGPMRRAAEQVGNGGGV